MFIDEAVVRVRGGRGGNGVIHFISNRHTPRGGPDGGSGGPGGDVIFRASLSVSTLHAFRNRPLFEAGNGVDGKRNNQTGARGEDYLVHVPIGTIIKDMTSGEVLADLAAANEEVVVAAGGEHGRGNSSFTTTTRRAPRVCERGLGGDERTLRLELKLIADVGIIGFPNVGKSSLISSVSGKKAQVADYPFTTITPNLGVVDVDGRNSFVAVDVPGLVEGAHEGRGLGDRFLRHIERTRLFIHMVDLATLEERDPVDDYCKINAELVAFNPALGERPQLAVGNKIDVLDEEAVEEIRARFAAVGVDLLPISVATRTGLRELVGRAYSLLVEERGREVSAASPVRRRIYRFAEETGFRIERDEDAFVVAGREVEKLVQKLILNTRDALEYLSDRLEKMGVLKELRRMGYQAGDVVRIGEVELELEG